MFDNPSVGFFFLLSFYLVYANEDVREKEILCECVLEEINMSGYLILTKNFLIDRIREEFMCGERYVER